jgi:hypothetical protein
VVEQHATARIGEGLEHLVHSQRRLGDYLVTCQRTTFRSPPCASYST